MTAKYFWGIDCGSSEIKVLVCDPSGKVLHTHRKRTLFPLPEHVRKALIGDGKFHSPFIDDSNKINPEHKITATGYGRNHIDFIESKLTEIKAHFIGVDRQMNISDPYTIIDIGGQDSKVINVKDRQVQQFVINRKCAAGTGMFIEELAHRLEIKLEDLTALEAKHDQELTLNSYCTVFAGQEVVKILMNGEKVENLIHALYQSVVKRVFEMTPITNTRIVFSGGVLQFNPALHRIFKQRLPQSTFELAPNAQFCGALGAAIYGLNPKE